jgi:hypothetical protein
MTPNTKTIHVYLKAGVGNRLFQYASAKGLAYKYGMPFNVAAVEYDGCHRNEYEWFIEKIRDDIHTCDFSKFKHYVQPDCEHVGVLSNIKELENDETNDVMLFGYFQHENYFHHISDTIRNIFKIRPETEKALDNFAVVSGVPMLKCYALHIRLGDYINCGLHFVNLLNYYKSAVQILRDQNSGDRLTFLLICEDYHNISYVYPGLLEFILEKDKVIVFNATANNHDKVELDLYAMTRCAGVVCGNSTFAWWGAWLNANPDKKVFIPNKWLQGQNGSAVGMQGAILLDT